jgi:anti-sigma regulatory factor (Ser/Thr protein kinase)
MRWRPGSYRTGEWEGEAWQWPDLVAADSGSPESPKAVPEMPPWMQAALGKAVPVEQRQLTGAAGATYRLRVPPWAIPLALHDLRRLRRIVLEDRDSFALSLGLGTGGALYLLVIATSPQALERLHARSAHRRFLQRWGDRTWCSTWEPEAEFGHWEAHKLRDGQLVGKPSRIDANLPAQPSSAREARGILRARLPALDSASLQVLQLLTSELVANSARHAGLHTEEPIGLQVRAKHDCIRVEVIDRGRQFEPRVPLAKSALDTSGWGLFIINQMADRWGVIHRPPRRHVWFEVHVPVADHAEPRTAAGRRGTAAARPAELA